MHADELDYCRKRAFQEDEAARIAACEPARQRHLEMAARYRRRCGESGASSETLNQELTPFLHLVL